MTVCCGIDEVTSNFPDLPPGTEIPVKNRKQTDLKYFIILVLFFLFLVTSLIIIADKRDIRRRIKNYDDKGNLCGFKNEPVEGIIGSGLDQTENKFLQMSRYCLYVPVTLDDTIRFPLSREVICRTVKECVNKCEDGYIPSIIAVCIEKSRKNSDTPFLELVNSHLSVCWREILLLCFSSICLSGLILTLLLFANDIRVIFNLISISAIGLVIFVWTKWIFNDVQKESEKQFPDLNFAVRFTLFMLIIFVALSRIRKEKKLLAVLFEECGKCIKDIPTLLLQPVLTNIFTTVFACFMWISLVYVITPSKMEVDKEGKIYYPDNTFLKIISFLLVFAFWWLNRFSLASQDLVIAGAVSSWYFSRINGKLNSPVWRSFCMIVKNHLGSSAFGSFLSVLMPAFVIVYSLIKTNLKEDRFIANIGGVLRCVLNNSPYTMIVLLGEPFCKSASRASACYESSNITVSGVGCVLLISAKLLVLTTATFVGFAIFMGIKDIEIIWIPVIVVIILSYLCTSCFFSACEMMIETLILCSCVDYEMNKSLEKPYCMNENLKIILQLNEENKNRDEVTSRQDKDQNLLHTQSAA